MEAKEQELSTVLANLREDLARAQKEGQGHELRFAMEEIEVELNVAVKTEDSGKVGVKFYVITADLGGKLANSVTQKIKLKMKLVDKLGRPVAISGKETRP